MKLIKKIQHNGWDICSYDNNVYLLSYERDIIAETGACIEISEEVFNEAQQEGADLKSLFMKHNLHKCKKLFSINKAPTYPKPISTPDKHYGRAYIVTRENGKYYFEYILSRGAGSRKIEITEEIFEFAKNKDVGVSEIFEKFNLYHLDIPENDVK